ncbi:MAG: DUF4145 domain-containing protein [Smithella sp.]
MTQDSLIIKRFDELQNQMDALRERGGGGLVGRMGVSTYETASWQQWATSTQHILRVAFGDTSPHYRNFSSAYDKCSGIKSQVDALKGIFRAAKADYDGGYAFSMQTLISGEIYGDFVALAKGALAEGAKDVAAVLACAALEDALKRLALLNDLQVLDKSMQDIVNALKAKGLIGGAQKTLLDTMPKIRDYAMHANWHKITPQDVGSVIGFVEQLLLTKFS